MGAAYTNQTLLLGLQLGPEFLDLAFGTALPLLRGRQLFSRTQWTAQERVPSASAQSAKMTSSPPTGGRGHEYVGVADGRGWMLSAVDNG